MASIGTETHRFPIGRFVRFFLGAAGVQPFDPLADLVGRWLSHALQHLLSGRMHRYYQGNLRTR